MKTYSRALFVGLLLLSLIIFACRQGNKPGNPLGGDTVSLKEHKPIVNKYDTMGEGLPIFYNMYLSVEMSSLFESSGAIFDQDLLNSSENMANYNTSSKMALNLGVYAVDLSYSKVFEQYDVAGRYFSAMERMAEELGIPADYFENTAKRFDRNINDKDSLIKIANEVYMTTDNYLKENERYSASAQIILGGWIEAIHIAVDIATKTKDINILERLADQRNSLANLIDMLNNYKDDKAISQYLVDLDKLKPIFDSFEVNVKPDFNANSPEGKTDIQLYLTKTNEVGLAVNKLRKKITE